MAATLLGALPSHSRTSPGVAFVGGGFRRAAASLNAGSVGAVVAPKGSLDSSAASSAAFSVVPVAVASCCFSVQRRRVLRSSRQHVARAARGRVAGQQRDTRSRVDPDAMTAMDTQAGAKDEPINLVWKDGDGKTEDVLKGEKKTIRAEATKKAVVERGPQEPLRLDNEGEDLALMDDIARADVVDRLTREAFVFLEAGDVKDATQQFDKVSRVVDLFSQLDAQVKALEEPEPEKRMPLWMKGRNPVLLSSSNTPMIDPKSLRTGNSDNPFKMAKQTTDQTLQMLRRELVQEDFNSIFGGEDFRARFIGGW